MGGSALRRWTAPEDIIDLTPIILIFARGLVMGCCSHGYQEGCESRSDGRLDLLIYEFRQQANPCLSFPGTGSMQSNGQGSGSDEKIHLQVLRHEDTATSCQLATANATVERANGASYEGSNEGKASSSPVGSSLP